MAKKPVKSDGNGKQPIGKNDFDLDAFKNNNGLNMVIKEKE